MNNSTTFSVGIFLDQVLQNEVRKESSSAVCDDEGLSQAADFGIKQATNAGFYYPPVGGETENQQLLNMKLPLTEQQENLDSLSSTLNHCRRGPGSGDSLHDHAASTVDSQSKNDGRGTAHGDDEYLSQAADFGTKQATNSSFFCTSVGTENEKQLKELLNMKLQLAKQQETLDSLSSALNHCRRGSRSGDRLRGHFPTKLYAMLELSAHVDGSSSNAFAWLPHGRAFKVPDKHTFLSFHKQLSSWGFKRLTRGRDVGAWCNEFFLRGSPGEIKKIARISVKEKSKPNISVADHKEPDFCSMTAALPRSVRPAAELLQGDGDCAEETSSSNKSANEIQYYVNQFLSQTKNE
ncbi:hypothetical protein ACHAXR_008405 [Thalassiosira sp. AJA248-18]